MNDAILLAELQKRELQTKDLGYKKDFDEIKLY